MISNPFNTPSIGLIADGDLVDSDVNECDTDAVEAQGYGWILDAEVTVGTAYPFYTEFFLRGDNPPVPEVVILGNPTGDEALFYEPTVIADIPPPPG